MSVKRWDIVNGCLDEHIAGMYVMHSDYAALENERDEWKKVYVDRAALDDALLTLKLRSKALAIYRPGERVTGAAIGLYETCAAAVESAQRICKALGATRYEIADAITEWTSKAQRKTYDKDPTE